MHVFNVSSGAWPGVLRDRHGSKVQIWEGDSYSFTTQIYHITIYFLFLIKNIFVVFMFLATPLKI